MIGTASFLLLLILVVGLILLFLDLLDINVPLRERNGDVIGIEGIVNDLVSRSCV